MKSSQIKTSGIIFASLLLILGFQNCNKVSMSPTNVDSSSKSESSGQSDGSDQVDSIGDDTEAQPPVIVEEGEESDLSPTAGSGGSCGGDGGQHITNIGENAFVLLCSKDLVHITNISANAKVIIVGGSVGHITNVALGAQVITVEVDGRKAKEIKITKASGEVRLASEAEAAQYKADCQSIDALEVAASAANYQQTSLSVQGAALVPKLAGKYMFTNINEGVQLLDLHSNKFSATNIKPSVRVTVRTKEVRITNISKNVHAELQ